MVCEWFALRKNRLVFLTTNKKKCNKNISKKNPLAIILTWLERISMYKQHNKIYTKLNSYQTVITEFLIWNFMVLSLKLYTLKLSYSLPWTYITSDIVINKWMLYDWTTETDYKKLVFIIMKNVLNLLFNTSLCNYWGAFFFVKNLMIKTLWFYKINWMLEDFFCFVDFELIVEFHFQ